jgi:hypothetical protein
MYLIVIINHKKTKASVEEKDALVRSHFDYCSEVWDTLGVGLSSRLQNLQKLPPYSFQYISLF